MKIFLRENIALVAGVTLPLMLVILFVIADYSSRMLADDPQYDAVFATHYYAHIENKYALEIENGKLRIRVTPRTEEDEETSYRRLRTPEIYLFDHKTMHTEKIDIDFNSVEGGYVTGPALNKLNARGRFSTDATAPDGYRFTHQYEGSHSFFLPFVMSASHGYRYSLEKNGRHIPLLDKSGYHGHGHFIGWINTND